MWAFCLFGAFFLLIKTKYRKILNLGIMAHCAPPPQVQLEEVQRASLPAGAVLPLQGPLRPRPLQLPLALRKNVRPSSPRGATPTSHVLNASLDVLTGTLASRHVLTANHEVLYAKRPPKCSLIKMC